MSVQILVGDAMAQMATLPDKSIHCCVTSPPYFGLRDYGTGTWDGGDVNCDHKPSSTPSERGIASSTLGGGKDHTGHKLEGCKSECLRCGAIRTDRQLGLEKTPEEYVAKMVEVFREVRRVLRDDGTLWVNLGDSYSFSGKGGNPAESKHRKQATNAGSLIKGGGDMGSGLAPKNLLGIPWRVAFALQADGWVLRQDIIWSKPNPMPESVRDRCTKAHEYVFLFAKSKRYFFDADAIATPVAESTVARLSQPTLFDQIGSDRVPGKTNGTMKASGTLRGANRRSVWKISTRSYKGAHFAVFPPELVEPCVMAGTSEFGCCSGCGSPFRRVVAKNRIPTRPGTDSTKSPDPQRHVTTTVTTGSEASCKCQDTGRSPAVVLDPFAGSGTTGQVAKSLGRNAVLIELNPEYVPLIEKRLASVKAKTSS